MKKYFTLKEKISYEEKIKRSSFIVTLKGVSDIAGAKSFIAEVAAEHRTASHNCWAYIIGAKADISHSSDAGEPSGTAGKPILNALQKNALSNVAAVVTHYFGGVKLGVRGLIEAYGSTTETAISQSDLIRIVKIKKYCVKIKYDFNDTFNYNLKQLHGKVVDTEYSSDIGIRFEAEEEFWNDLENYLENMHNSGRIIRLQYERD